MPAFLTDNQYASSETITLAFDVVQATNHLTALTLRSRLKG